MVTGCAWVRVFLVAGDKALAYALQVWSAMADGEVRQQRETGRGGSPWVAWKNGWWCHVDSRPCSSGSRAVPCQDASVM